MPREVGGLFKCHSSYCRLQQIFRAFIYCSVENCADSLRGFAFHLTQYSLNEGSVLLNGAVSLFCQEVLYKGM